MKRLLALMAISSLLSANAMAESTPFTGVYLGGKISSVKQTFSVPYSELGSPYSGRFTADGSRGMRVGVSAGYGFDMGSNFVGLGEASLAISNVKTKNELGETVSKETIATSIAYLQGYRLTNNILPYVKVSLNASSFDMNDDALPRRNVAFENSGAYGFGLGAGVRILVADKFTVGAEHNKYTLKAEDNIKFKTNDISLNVHYHF